MKWRQGLHRVTRALGWVAGVAVIVLAILVALVQLSLPLLAKRPQWVAAWLSERLQQPISLAALEAHWHPAGPRLVLREVAIQPAAGGDALRMPQVELQLDLGSMIFQGRYLFNLYARGMRLNLVHDADGSWRVNGFGIGGAGNHQHNWLDHVSMDLRLRDSRVSLNDAGKHYLVLVDQLRLNRQAGRIRIGGSLRREGVAGTLHGAGSFHQDGRGRLWLAGEAMDLPGLSAGIAMDGYTAESGHGNAAMWLDWRNGKVARSLIRVDLQDLRIASVGGNRARIAALHGLAELRRDVDKQQLVREELRWASDDGGALVGVLRQPGTDQARIDLGARALALETLLPWLALKPQLSVSLAQWLSEGHSHGNLSRVTLHWTRVSGLEAVEVAFKDIGIGALGKLPGVDHLDGVLRGDDRAYALELPAQATLLSFPDVFHQPFAMAKLAGTLVLWHEDNAWHIGTDPFVFKGTSFGGSVRGEVALPDEGGGPFLDLYAAIDHANVTAARQFWPNAMSPTAVEWLNRALVAGKIDGADIVVRGDLKDWPFRHNEGRFEAHAELSDLVLDYAKGWPRAQGVHVSVDFVDKSMRARIDAGQSLGIKIDKAVALIPDFADTTLDLTMRGSGSGAGVMAFVSKSPIANRQADVLAKLGLGGNAAFDFHLSLPVKDTSHVWLKGAAQLNHSYLRAPTWKLALEQLEGPLRFDAHGLRVGPLRTTMHGRPAILQMALAGANTDPAITLSARLGGNFSVAELLRDYPSLKWLGDTSHGRSDFDIGFVIAHVARAHTALAQTITIDSPLRGLALDLPAPLKKSTGDTLPLHVSLGLPIGVSDVQLALGQVARARLRLPSGDTQPLAASVMLGGDVPEAMPEKGIRVRGHPALMDINGWVQQTAGSGGGNRSTPISLESIDVLADRALIFDHAFPAMHLQVASHRGALELDADSAAIAGHVSVPGEGLRERGITAHMQRLYWPQDSPPGKEGKPTTTPVTKAVPPPANPAATGITPAALPPLHLWVSDLRLGQAMLGAARLETWPIAQGMHIDQLRACSRSVQLNANGDWLGTADNSHTHLRVDFSAEDLGAMLTALGFSGLFAGGKTHAVLNASWPGAPSSIDWANMDGTLGLKVSHGRILDVAPGVGRVFGLFSLAELPRRMKLDFGDVFGKGLGFDSIVGDFHLADGNATTNNLKIDSPAAGISITGRTGLRAHDYDQRMIVVPHIGNSLPIVGAVVAGPVGMAAELGVAAGLAVQGLLGHGLNKAAGKRYRITGNWDKPVITSIDKHAAAGRPNR